MPKKRKTKISEDAEKRKQIDQRLDFASKNDIGEIYKTLDSSEEGITEEQVVCKRLIW